MPRTQKTQVAVFGGSFDPPHAAHLLAAVYALRILGVDRVLVVPVFEHAFSKQMAAFEHRVQMCRLTFRGIRGVTVSAVEARLKRPSYTLRTLRHLAESHPQWQLRLLIGSDVLAETHRWHAFDRIEHFAPLLVLGRPGHRHPSATLVRLPDISSTRIRNALRSSRGPHPDRRRTTQLIEQSLAVPVRDYIATRGLYR